MPDCEQSCEDCNCGVGEKADAESETPNLDLLEQLNALQGMRQSEDTQKISIDRDNADLYAFSDIGLRQMREGNDAENPLDWSTPEIQLVALQIVGNKLDV